MRENWKTSSEVEWNEQFIHEFCNYLYEIVDLKTCRELEKEIRIETGTCDRMDGCKNARSPHDAHDHNVKEKCTDTKDVNLNTYKFKKDEDDIVGEILDNEKEEDVIKKSIPYIAKKAFIVYSNVVRKAKEENEYMDADTDNFLRMHIFKILLTKVIVSNVRKRVKELHCKNTKDISGLANPLHVKDNTLESITNETMSDLMKKGVAVQKNFIGKSLCELIYKELQFIEYNNQFNEFNTEYVKIRTDFYCWTYINNLDRERQRGLYKLLKALALLPFELNKKANLSLQMCSLFQFAYFAPDKSFLKKHYQGGFDIADTGKKITLIYIPYVHPDEQVTLKVYKRSHQKNSPYKTQNKKEETKVNEDIKNKENEKEKEKHIENEKQKEKQIENEKQKEKQIENEKEKDKENETKKKDADEIEEKESLLLMCKPQSDSLIFLQTRNTTYEISKTTQKFFVINFWISGPVSPDKTM